MGKFIFRNYYICNYSKTFRTRRAKQYFEDVLQHGCQWWTVPSMIYTTNVHKFYDKFYNEIEDLRIYLHDEWILYTEHIDQDIKTYYSWLAYEHKAYEIYSLINEDF